MDTAAYQAQLDQFSAMTGQPFTVAVSSDDLRAMLRCMRELTRARLLMRASIDRLERGGRGAIPDALSNLRALGS